MSRKKIIIYSGILVTFILLFSIYILILLQSTDSINRKHLRESRNLLTVQIQKNLEYQSKNLHYEFNKYDLNHAKTLEDLLYILSNTDLNDWSNVYIADENGVLYKNEGIYNGRSIDASSLKHAKNNGYAAIGILDIKSGEQSVGISVPINDNSFYLVKIHSLDQFMDIITADVSFPVESLLLFDEWCNTLNSFYDYNESDDNDVNKSIIEGATAYNLDDPKSQIQSVGFFQNYNIYIRIGQPNGWFLGARVNYSTDNPISSGILGSSLIMFVLFIIIIAVVVILDIVNDREKKKELFLVSNMDQLTGLVNSFGMQEAVTNFMQKNQTIGYSFVCMDIVSFSRINTMFGYSTGDMLLRTISNVIRESYLCGIRTDADHFSFLAKTSENMASDIESLFYNSIETHIGKEYLQLISFKFGIYPINESKATFREIYDGATLALKDAKKQNRQSEVIYDSELKKTNDLQKNIEINMMHALSKEEFVLYVQPQYDIATGQCARGEALIRWQSDLLGFLTPDKFIPIFENNGFIVETDFFMLSSALQLLQDRLDKGESIFTLAVNQSKVTISFPNYYERLKALVRQFSVPLEYIELEITESALQNDLDTIIPLMHRIKKLGLAIAMDDFGSGFSSLNTLRLMPIDILKIDRAFLEESNTSEKSKKIIGSIIDMAKELDINVVCEGVETIEQLDFLRKAGCDIAQGYYYSKPIPVNAFVKSISK